MRAVAVDGRVVEAVFGTDVPSAGNARVDANANGDPPLESESLLIVQVPHCRAHQERTAGGFRHVGRSKRP